MQSKQGSLFIVSGPSGVGKTTVVTEFLKQCDEKYAISRVVTYTTKNPRMTETHGVDYHFITQSEFERKIKDSFFLEWSGEYGACYGTPASIIKDLEYGISYILIIDRVGAAQIKEKYPSVILIWIEVSSVDVLLHRLKSRKTETEEMVQRRLFLAKKEIAQESSLPMYDYHISNDELNAALKGIFDIIAPRIFPVQKV